jgi:hypothetical protein
MDLPDLVRMEEIGFSAIDLCFCALPHKTSQEVIAALPKDLKIVDLSADFRLRDPEEYARWYGNPHAAMAQQAAADRDDAGEQKRVEERLAGTKATTPAESDAEFMRRNPGFGLRGWNTPKDRKFVQFQNGGRYYTAVSDDAAMIRRIERAGWTAAAPAADFTLAAPTRQQVLDQQQARTDETKSEAARRRLRDEQERKDRERKDNAARMDASAENFELGQNAEQSLSGQGGLFQARAGYANRDDPFAAGYSRLEGRKLAMEVRIEDTGQTATLRTDSAQYMRELDSRLDTARRLAGCIAR